MAETDNPEAPISAPRTARFGEGPEGKVARRERGHTAPQAGPGRLTQFLRDGARFVAWLYRGKEYDHHYADRGYLLRHLFVCG
jgi:hypothetical protein